MSACGTVLLTILIDTAADQLLVLHESEVGFDSGGIAIHHEADGAGWREHADLGVTEAGDGATLCASAQQASAASNMGAERGGYRYCCTAFQCMRMTSRNGSSLTA